MMGYFEAQNSQDGSVKYTSAGKVVKISSLIQNFDLDYDLVLKHKILEIFCFCCFIWIITIGLHYMLLHVYVNFQSERMK